MTHSLCIELTSTFATLSASGSLFLKGIIVKKILFLLIASSASTSALGVNTPSESGCRMTEHETNACCGQYLPQIEQPPFYQPSHALLNIQNDEVYLPQTSSTSISQPIIPRPTSQHFHRTQYNPADPLFETLRNCFSSRRVIPAQTTESLNTSPEQESISPAASWTSRIINHISHCMSLNLCIRCRSE